MFGGPRKINATAVQAASDRAGVRQLLAALGYDTSQPSEQTAASLGVAERSQQLVRNVWRIGRGATESGAAPCAGGVLFRDPRP